MPRLTPTRLPALALIASLAALNAGCATTGGGAEPTQPLTAEEIYQAGREALAREEYGAAARHFRMLAVNHPDSGRTPRARMELAYAYYKGGHASSAIAAAERFISDHPDHPDLDYLYYLRGLANFTRAISALQAEDQAGGTDLPTAELALQHFSELLARFPDSRYSDDARNRITHLKDRLAQRQLRIAKRYLNRGDYANAGLYARGITNNYPETTAAGEAAEVTSMAQRMLRPQSVPAAPGQAPAAQDTAADIDGARGVTWLLQQNPDSYTIQLLSTTDETALQAFIRRHHRLGELAYFGSSRNGKPWYSLVYGVFPDPGEARGAAEKLPPSLRDQRPWIRKLSDVQAAIAVEETKAAGTD